MRKMKKTMYLLLALVMTLSVGFAVNGTEAKAADDKLKAPKNVRCGIGMANSGYAEIPVASMEKKGDVKNIKVYDSKGKKKTKDAVVRKTRLRRYSSKDSEGSQSYAELQFYAKKAGKYVVKYDLYENGKKKGKTRQFNIRANGYGKVLSSVVVDKKDIRKYVSGYNPDSYYTTKDKISIKFKVAPGCKIKKIEMLYYDKNGKMKTKKIKNGQKVTLGKYGNSYTNTSDSSYTTSSKDMWAETTFRITYTDSYDQYNTKAKQETYYYVYKKAAKWYKSKY